MTECSRFHRIIESYPDERISESERDEIQEHSRTCSECRRMLALHDDLKNLATEFPDPGEDEFENMREAVLSQVAHAGLEKRSWSAFAARVPERPLWAVAAALILVLMGGIVGGTIASRSSDAEPSSRLVREIREGALNHDSFSDLENAPFFYSNVVFRTLQDGRLDLSFDVTTHVDLIEPVGSPLVKEVLVNSLLNPSPLGSRLKAIDYAEGLMDDKIREALILALHKDPSLAVRLKALSILGRNPHDPQIEAAVLETLRSDDAVQMRLQALDYLARNQVDPILIDEAIRELDRENDAAVLLRAASYQR